MYSIDQEDLDQLKTQQSYVDHRVRHWQQTWRRCDGTQRDCTGCYETNRLEVM